jgi:two-component system OmpR family response regulator
MRILLVEDARKLAQAVCEHLHDSGHAVDHVETLEDAGLALESVEYGAALLDLRLPDGDGLELLRQRRRKGDRTPVIILTARDQVRDRIEGLNAGADDYLVKPFDLDELTARLSAVARRYGDDPNPVLSFGGIEIDRPRRQLRRGGAEVPLTAREWAILDLLAQRPGAILSRSRLEEALYAFGAEIESNAVEVYISRLRKKVGPGVIETRRGVGYRLEA